MDREYLICRPIALVSLLTLVLVSCRSEVPGPLPSDMADGLHERLTVTSHLRDGAWVESQKRVSLLDEDGNVWQIRALAQEGAAAGSFVFAQTFDYSEDGRVVEENYWEPEGSSWRRVSRMEYRYDELGRLVSTHARSLEDGEWVDARAQLYRPRENGGEIEVTTGVPEYDVEGMPVFAFNDSDQRVSEWRVLSSERRYLSGGRVDSIIVDTWDQGFWKPTGRTIFVYGDTGVVQPSEVLVYQMGTHVWLPRFRTEYDYEGHELRRTSRFKYEAGSWVEVSKEVVVR